MWSCRNGGGGGDDGKKKEPSPSLTAGKVAVEKKKGVLQRCFGPFFGFLQWCFGSTVEWDGDDMVGAAGGGGGDGDESTV